MIEAKRAMDLLLGGTALVLSLPLQAMIALAVRLDSPGPSLYRAKRVGRGGLSFTVLKFRSMRRDAANTGPAITGASDPRVTRVGLLLRRTKLDELPQLWNVLRGDMSLVGPRPEDSRFTELYPEEYRRILSVRPGITGPSQIAFIDEERLLAGDIEATYIGSILPQKVALDLEYVRDEAILRDAAILLQTLRALVRPPPAARSQKARYPQMR
ncbi:MAG: sugar transferase [Chloroflexota bacterium]|nr:sugar transferase [Chloroflexota bacterium]